MKRSAPTKPRSNNKVRTPTYDNIRNLAIQLQQDTGVKLRRQVGERLLQQVSKDDVRRKLGEEATQNARAHATELSVAATRCHALSQLWKVILGAAISFAESFGAINKKNKAKLTEFDIKLPYNLLVQCDKPDAAFDNIGLGIDKLPKSTVRKLLSYCLNKLADEKTVELAELHLLEMLNHLCSHVSHVGQFKLDTDLGNILIELSYRLDSSPEEKSHSVVLAAAKGFDSLFTSSKTLGIQVHYLLQESIELVSSWCKGHIKADTVNPSSDILPHFFSAVTSLLECHPEHAIGPLKRHGRHILSFARRCYPNARGVQKSAISNYLLAHILVSQVAGRIQGLMPGDFGDLGKATLSEKTVTTFLGLVVDDIGNILSLETSTTGAAKERQQKQARLWRPLEFKQRRQMELCARLMASAQRQYLARVEWAAIDDPTEALTKLLGTPGEGDDEWCKAQVCHEGPCPVGEFARSPWVEYVVKNLYQLAAPVMLASSTTEGRTLEHLSQDTSFDSSLTSLGVASFELLSYLASLTDSSQRTAVSPISVLPVIVSCAEAFPAGDCWISSTLDHWYPLPPSDPLSEDVLYCHSCTPEDLSMIVYLVSILLEIFGRPGGDLDVQGWILLALIRLTETSAICYTYTDKASSLESLMLAWRRVWKTLFRSDLRYAAYTEAAAATSLGELVLVLLTEIVHRNCADPAVSLSIEPSARSHTFVYEHQAQIWCLPAFANHRSIKTTSPFELIFSLLQQVGLSEFGNDNIDASLAPVLFNTRTSELRNVGRRRRRLLCLVVARLESHMSLPFPDSRFAEVVAACIVVLIHGRGDMRTRTFLCGAQGPNRFKFTSLSSSETPVRFEGASQDTLSEILWSLPGVDGVDATVGNFMAQIDVIRVTRSRIHSSLLRTKPLISQFADFVSEAETGFLRTCVLAFLDLRLYRGVMQDHHVGESGTFPVALNEEGGDIKYAVSRRPGWKTLALKLMLTMNFPSKEDFCHRDLKAVLVDFIPTLEKAASTLSFLCSIPKEFLRVSTDLLQIIRWLVEITASGACPDIQVGSLDIIMSECKSLLEAYSVRMKNGNPAAAVSRTSQKATKIQSDWDDLLFASDDEMVGDDLVYETPKPDTTAESDEDADEPPSKRKRDSLSGSAERGPKGAALQSEGSRASAPDLLCAKRISSIILSLDPSFLNCQFICQALLGQDLEMEPSTVQRDVDIKSGIHCIDLLNDESVFVNRRAVREMVNGFDSDETSSTAEESPIVMVCRAVELIRVGASLASPHYLFGFQACAQSVWFGENIMRGCSVSDREARILVDVLKMDTGIEYQPHRRADRVRAAATAFQAGGQKFHIGFDKDFANCFVKPSLTDSSTQVRKEASIAVGAALKHLDETRTEISVSKLIAPVVKGENREAAMGEFRKWYENFESGLPADNVDEKNMFLGDAFETMESDALYCRAVMSGSDRSVEGFLGALYYLASVPLTRPELEASCFQALEKVASMRKYQTVEDMIDHEAEGLLRIWFYKKQSLRDLPLLISAPNILRRLLRAGHSKLLAPEIIGASDKQRSDVDIDGVKLEAATSFSTKYRRFVVPLCLVHVVRKNPSSSEPPGLANNEGEQIGDPDLRELSALLLGDGADDEDSVKKMLHCHIHDIQAFGYMMTHSDEARHIQNGHDILKLVTSSISESVMQSQSKKKAHVIVRRILELSGKCNVFTGILPKSQQAYFDAITTFVNDMRFLFDPNRGIRPETPKGDPFLAVGASYTTCFILANHWLDTAWLIADRLQRWQSIDLLCAFIIKQVGRHEPDCIQLGFCLHTLLEVIANAANAPCVHLRALERLDDVLVETLPNLGQMLGAELNLVLKRIIGTCFHVHEAGQRKLLSSCTSKWRDTRRVLQRSLGLRRLSTTSGHDVSGWGWDANDEAMGAGSPLNLNTALREYGTDVGQAVTKGLFSTFKILKDIVANEANLGLNAQFFPNTASEYPSPSDLDALEATDSRFCAQNIVFRVVDQGSHEADDGDVSVGFSVRDSLTNRHALTNKTNLTETTPAGLSCLNVDQRLLYADLVLLEQTLRSQPDKSKGLDFMVRELSYICGASCPDVLRFAASRCLGEVQPAALEGIALLDECPFETKDWIGEAIEKDRLQVALRAKSLEFLGDCLKSSSTEISIVASETLEALFSTREGAKYLKLITDPAKKTLLEPFACSSRVDRSSSPPPPESFLRSMAGVVAAVDSDDWCWNDVFWCCPEQGEKAFEDWICLLVPALILCCYKASHEKGCDKLALSNEFFSQCAKICSIEPGLCSALFPCIVLDLLEDSIQAAAGEDGSGDFIFDDRSGMNFRLSKSFRILLDHSFGVAAGKPTRPPNSKALALAIDTLGMLMRVNQHIFLTSSRHRRNPLSLPNHSFSKKLVSPPKKGRRSSTPPSPELYLKDLPPPKTWSGVRFGIVLQLDGLLVARSCVLVRRFASALFYIDLHLNARLGDAGGVLERLSNESEGNYRLQFHQPKADISGHVATENNSEGSTSVEISSTALDAMTVMAECFQELHEEEALEAVKIQRSSLMFVQSDFVEDADWDRRAPSLYALQRLNTRSNLTGGSHPTPLLVTGCMEELGIRRILQTYIEGLAVERNLPGCLDEPVRQSLREKWFEGSLYSRQWDINLGVQGSSLSESADAFLAPPSAPTGEFASRSLDFQFGVGGGFFESLSGALDSFLHDDMETCRSLVIQCRRSLLGSASIAAVEESSLLDMVTVVDRLNAIGGLERLAARSTSPDLLLREWGLEPDSQLDSQKMSYGGTSVGGSRGRVYGSPQQKVSSQTFSFNMREIILRVFCLKNGAVSDRLKSRRSLISHLWDCSAQARLAGSPSEAEAALQRLLSVLKLSNDGGTGTNGLSLDTVLRVRLEESKILESRGDFSGAIRKCKQTIDHLKQHDDNALNCLLADALVMCGTWMADYKVQQAKVILESYLRPGADRAMMIYEKDKIVENAERAASASLALAQLVANLYETLSTRVKSSDWRKMGESIKEQEEDLKKCGALLTEATKRKSKTKNEVEFKKLEAEEKEINGYYSRLKAGITKTKEKRLNIEQSVGPHLNLAVRSFANALSIADAGSSIDLSKHIFRMVSLWFSGSKDSKDKENVNSIMADAIHEIPTFRFVPLANQLFSRIERIDMGQEKTFQKVLQKLMFKMCVDHPYHCIVQVIALSNGKNVGSGRNARDFLKNVGDSKVAAASEILLNLEKEGQPFIQGLVASYKLVAEAYVQLANADTTSLQEEKKLKSVSFSQLKQLLTVRLDKILRFGYTNDEMEFPPCVFTKPPPIRPGADYGDGIRDPIGGERIAGFQSTFDIAETGVHRPIIVFCKGAKGKTYRQLVKGEDELRQDAIMSQVFSFVNGLMLRRGGPNNHSSGSMGENWSTSASRLVKHTLRLICYNIVPLSPVSGVLEWVEDTMPFGMYMHDKSRANLGAHSKYYPGEWHNNLCRNCFGNTPPTMHRETFDAICQHYSPVFRFFFLERFGASMSDWYSAKQKYTRSVAVNSIVGHILGIGDRHLQNILVHQKTGEVVHIDFGIVFEQGKNLQVPETIPFRLTRNVVDGMGPTGTEGTFSRAAEETSRMLRENANALLTILSAVVSDPLYKWSVSPVQARRRQAENDDDEAEGKYDLDNGNNGSELNDQQVSDEDHNKAAAETLAKIQEKLQGYEDGTSGEQQSVEGQVQLLVNQARDPDNLCRLYVGWAPWV